MNDASTQRPSPRNPSARDRAYRRDQPWRQQPGWLLTVTQAAELLGLAPKTVQHYLDRHLIGHVTWRWRYGVIARARRYVPKVAVPEFLERRGQRRVVPLHASES